MLEQNKYHSLSTNFCRYVRRKASVVNIGIEKIGGNYPVMVQSMGTVDVKFASRAAEQAELIFMSGSKAVRFTAQGISEAKSLGVVRTILNDNGINLPLIADIHFNRSAAIEAARYVEKVRINPGNFIDKRADLKQIEYSDTKYNAQLKILEKAFSEFLDICIKNSTSIRIGVNHGSLSDRIMSRYGDTIVGMVESAMEFLRICQKRNFNNVVVSMKSSNTVTMVTACRLLCETMTSEGMNYPLHLGVTEAGEGNDGRIRSAVGIGALLNDGIGDTIRVSLTENPENEVPVAQCLVDYYKNREVEFDCSDVDFSKYNPYTSNNFKSRKCRVIFDASSSNIDIETLLNNYQDDYIYIGQRESSISSERIIREFDKRVYYATLESLKRDVISADKIIIIEANSSQYQRAVALYINQLKLDNIVILKRSYSGIDYHTLQLYSSADLGGLLIDGFGDGIWISSSCEEDIEYLPLSILQASGRRVFKAQYISCPGCGRTLYDLQSVVRELKERTTELTSIKIAIMGCIVNGPGEMADADYGYVGSGEGRVTLYKKREIVERNIPSTKAIDRLITLIKENGDWR